jgi:2-haloacid dehalogenase
MSRRRFLLGAAALATTACAGVPRARATSAIRAVAFDLFTVFDPRGIDAQVRALVPEASDRFAAAWRTRAFEHAWIRAAAGRYVDFRRVLGEALVPVAAEEGIGLDAGRVEALISTFESLEPWPDAASVLADLRARGLRLVTLANYSPEMIERLVARAGLADQFDALLSTDAARTFKPDPRAYAVATDALGLPREAVAFAAFGSWDAAGGAWFGYPTFWVNRLSVTRDPLVDPTPTGSSLLDLAAWALALSG